MNNYIDSLKQYKKIGSNTSFSLYKNLLNYKEKVLAIDSSARDEFSNSFNILSGLLDQNKSGQNEFYQTFFKNVDSVSSKAILSKFQNNIRTIENKILHYFNQRTTWHKGIIDYFSTSLVGQNSKTLRPGEILEISAGIGNFTVLSQQSINIAGKEILLDENGIAVYKHKINVKPGLYKVPIKLSFVDPYTGKESTQERIVEYKVVE